MVKIFTIATIDTCSEVVDLCWINVGALIAEKELADVTHDEE
jgi:hypothetical protein